MRITQGQQAPAYAGVTATGAVLSSSSLQGRTVLLKFYRFAYCPICHLHVRELARRADELTEAGIEVVAVFHSPSRKVRKALRELELPFPVIADPDKRLFEAYGVEQSMRGMVSTGVMKDYARATLAGFLSRPVGHEGGIRTHPADFLIDPTGAVRMAHYGVDYADSLGVDDVLAAAATVRA